MPRVTLGHRTELLALFQPSAQDRSKLEARFEVANELELRDPRGPGVGIRFQTVWLLTEQKRRGCPTRYGVVSIEGARRMQTAFEPFLAYDTERSAVFVRLGVLIGLDGCLGVVDGPRRLAAIRTTVGVEF